MNYKEVLTNINEIKILRTKYINDFDVKYDLIIESLEKAKNNDKLGSIRLHKYLTDNKKLGKVNTARFLESIGLNETIKISQLNSDLIIKIAKYCSEK